MLDRLKRIATSTTKLIDTAHEAAHAVSACVELAREVENRRTEGAGDDVFELSERLEETTAERDQLRVELKSTVQELNILAHKLDWLTRWRNGSCPFPDATWIMVKDLEGNPNGIRVPQSNMFRKWRPSNLDLYEEFRDA